MAIKHNIDGDRKDRFVASPEGLTIRMPDDRTFGVVKDTNGKLKRVEKKKD
jgi:hypothetical protein